MSLPMRLTNNSSLSFFIITTCQELKWQILHAMRKLILLFTCMCLCCLTAFADKKKKADEDSFKFRYDIEYSKTAADGLLMVKVWSYSKKADIALEQCRKNAVHGVLFKGYAASTSTASQKPLVKDASIESTKADYFQAFFADNGPYMRYVSAVIDGTTEVRKVGKEYKIGVVVTVNKDMLRKHLEEAGIIKGLTSGF